MHFLAVSLLSILAGTLLLAKFKKEPLGKFFAFISWFFIVVGFILFIGFMTGGICKMTRHCCNGKPECKREIMIQKFGPGMMHGACCPEGMGRGMCAKMPGCMQHDSTMKCCPKHMKCDTVNVEVKVTKP
jgi:hypothetical protein